MVALKRSYHIAGPSADRLAKRLRRVETIQRIRTPEQKHRDITLTNAALADGNISLTELTAIAQGDGVADREGAEIRVSKIEFCGSTNTAGVDIYFISPKMNNAPAYGDFQSVTGGYANADAFMTWHKTISDKNGGLSSNGYHKFRYPLKIHYSGSASTGGQRNRIWMVVKNDTGAAISHEYAARIWYSDQ